MRKIKRYSVLYRIKMQAGVFREKCYEKYACPKALLNINFFEFVYCRGYSIDIYKKGDSWTKELLFDGTESVTIGDGKQYFAAVPFLSQRREPITTSPDSKLIS